MSCARFIARLRAALLATALLFALQPAAVAAQEAPASPSPSETPNDCFGMSLGQATILALAVGGLVVGAVAITAYYGPGTAIAALLAGHVVMDLALVGAGAGAAYVLWPWGSDPAPADPAGGAASPASEGTSL